jgi:hypothetical protein
MLLTVTESADSGESAVISLHSAAHCARVTKAALRTLRDLCDSNAFLKSRRGLPDFQNLVLGCALLEEGDFESKMRATWALNHPVKQELKRAQDHRMQPICAFLSFS